MCITPSILPSFHRFNHKGALQFIEWLKGTEALTSIRDFGKVKYGKTAFLFKCSGRKKTINIITTEVIK